MNKILVVNVNWVGDVIFSSPVFKALKEHYPQAKISCLAVPRVRDVLSGISAVDEIIVYDEEGRHKNPLAKWQLISELRKKKFDAAFLLHRSWTRAFLVFLAGIPQRIGYDTKNRGALLTHKVPPLQGPVHRSDHYLRVIESFGVTVKDRVCGLNVGVQEKEYAGMLLAKHGIRKGDFVIAMSAGGNWDLKRWPKENFSALIDGLYEQLNARVLLIGAAKDQTLACAIAENTKHKPVILTGQTNLKQLAALLQRADLFISGDTGPMHLANGVGTAVLGLFGPTRPEATGPRGSAKAVIIQNDVGCNQVSCYHLLCPDNVCMKSISVDQVLNEIRKIKN